MSRVIDSSVLIVCGQRDDRRLLFETAAELSFKPVLSAASPAQALEMLTDDPVTLLMVDLDGAERAPIEQLVDAFRSTGGQAVLGVMSGDADPAGINWLSLPGTIDDCIGRPINRDEVAFRCARLIEHELEDGSQAALEDGLAFDGIDQPLILSDPKYSEILAVNSAFAEWTGKTMEDWIGQPVDSIGLIEEPAPAAARWRILRSDGRVQFRSALTGLPGGDRVVDVVRRLGMFQGHIAYLTQLLDVSREARLIEGLELTAAMFAAHGADGMPTVIERLFQWLAVDFFQVVAIGRRGHLNVIASHTRNNEAMRLGEFEQHKPFQQLRRGEDVVIAKHAARVLGDDTFIDDNGIEAYIGIPIQTSRQRVVGAVIAASRSSLALVEERVAILHVLSAYFSARWENRDLRSKNHNRGLHDPLTGLPTRMLFNERLNQTVADAASKSEAFAVVFVDLDRFKTINDTLGQDVGDRVLLNVAARLRDGVRSTDTIGRFAGDQFTIILRKIAGKADVLRIARKLIQLLSAPQNVEGAEDLLATASLGISFFPDDGEQADALLKRADMAMQSAKGMGRNTFETYEHREEESSRQRLQLESRLRHAQANGELCVYYQPQVSARTEDIVGMEALLRWRHPEQGLISPGYFIPIAEETGLIVPIGEWLLREAISATQAWNERYGLELTLGVNLSALQLKQPNLRDVVEQALNEVNLEPRFLELEVTESISIKTISDLRQRLESLRDLGCGVSIDDFGTGQSSLDYLKRFPADRIKIDQSFVRNIGIDPDDAAIVRATINMAHSLGLTVVAEGVEEEDHLEFLRRHNCDELQGYLFCRPLSETAFNELLREREAMMTRQAS